jgi:hypothetical protein
VLAVVGIWHMLNLPWKFTSSFSMFVASLNKMESCRWALASFVTSLDLSFFRLENKLFFSFSLFAFGISLGSRGYGCGICA